MSLVVVVGDLWDGIKQCGESCNVVRGVFPRPDTCKARAFSPVLSSCLRTFTFKDTAELKLQRSLDAVSDNSSSSSNKSRGPALLNSHSSRPEARFAAFVHGYSCLFWL